MALVGIAVSDLQRCLWPAVQCEHICHSTQHTAECRTSHRPTGCLGVSDTVLSDLDRALIEPYIGELWTSTTADAVMKDSVQTGDEVGEDDEQGEGDIASRATHYAQLNLAQQKREKECRYVHR